MATLNIPRDVTDPFYRYKMERLQSKIEGKGNGIKTVIVNLSSVATSLARPPSYLIKYFGFELGAQTNIDPPDDRWIINGAHEASKLQDYLDGFISRFVLCRNCKNPETTVIVKEGITLDCKACGSRTQVDLRQKLSGFILKQTPKKGKKDKSTKKADRKARKEQQAKAAENGENGHASDGSPEGSNQASDNGDENGEVELEAGSDDELTRRIQNGAKEIDDEEKEVEWTVDTSEEAAKARAQDLPEEFKRTVAINGDDDDEDGDENNPYGLLGSWIDEQVKELGDVTKLDDVEIYKKAQELGIEKKHRTLTVLAQALFDENMPKQIEKRAPMLKKMMTSDRHEKAFLGGTERFVGLTKPALISSVPTILMKYYDNDLVSEEVLKTWNKASKKHVDITTSKKVRKSAEPFLKWLDEAEEEEEESE